MNVISKETLIGTIGATILLVFFVLNQFKIVDREDQSYDWANFLGALMLTIYGFLLSAWPFFALNLVWCLVSFKNLLVRKNNKI